MIALGYKKGIFDLMASLGVEKVKHYTAKFDAERPGFPKPAKPIQEYLDFPRDILVDKKDGVVILTQRRPQAANALSDKTCNEILAELKKGEADPSVKGSSSQATPKASRRRRYRRIVATFGNHEKGQALSRGNSRCLSTSTR